LRLLACLFYICDEIIYSQKMAFRIIVFLIVSSIVLLSFTSYKQHQYHPHPYVTDSSYYIIIDKSDFELKVYDAAGWYATYPVVFGSKDASDKMYEGDKRTPNGVFKIIQKKINPKWGMELLLDYPNNESVRRFNERKSKGLIPKKARIGDGIAIHGTRPSEEWTVDNEYNWTDGCISVKYSEMKDLFSYIPEGTKVTIQP